jgi:hypothetical protein
MLRSSSSLSIKLNLENVCQLLPTLEERNQDDKFLLLLSAILVARRTTSRTRKTCLDFPCSFTPYFVGLPVLVRLLIVGLYILLIVGLAEEEIFDTCFRAQALELDEFFFLRDWSIKGRRQPD